MKKLLPFVFALALLGCVPETPTEIPATTTTVPATTTTVVPATSTTIPASSGAVLTPSGGDDTARLVAAIAANPVVTVDGALKIDQIAALNGLSNKTITFTSRGKLVRSVRPDVRTFQLLALKNTTNITFNNLQIQGPNIQVCDFISYLTGKPNYIRVGYSEKHEAQHGLEIFASNGTKVNGGRIYGMSGDGVYIAGGSDGTTISNLTTECTGRSAVSNVNSRNTTINGGQFHLAAFWIFNIEPTGSWSVDNYKINNPRVGYSNWYWLMSAGPYFSCLVTNVVVDKPVFMEFQGATSIKPCVTSGIRINF